LKIDREIGQIVLQNIELCRTQAELAEKFGYSEGSAGESISQICQYLKINFQTERQEIIEARIKDKGWMLEVLGVTEDEILKEWEEDLFSALEHKYRKYRNYRSSRSTLLQERTLKSLGSRVEDKLKNSY